MYWNLHSLPTANAVQYDICVPNADSADEDEENGIRKHCIWDGDVGVGSNADEGRRNKDHREGGDEEGEVDTRRDEEDRGGREGREESADDEG